ncbi:hypothetical protein [Pseudomonas sp. xss_2]|uniref:hypothetical protein n=1 Tax=Pseudomonas sp. xss_2 TaxID=3367215 RepID=UPI00370A21AC
MNRMIKDAAIKNFHYLKASMLAFMTANNFARHLQALRWSTRAKILRGGWTKSQERFTINLYHFIP